MVYRGVHVLGRAIEVRPAVPVVDDQARLISKLESFDERSRIQAHVSNLARNMKWQDGQTKSAIFGHERYKVMKPGYFAHSLNAYGRGGEPCPRCGTPIKRESFMNRGSYFCPRCQRRR